MQYKDLLRGTVLLVAVEATALGAISGTGDSTTRPMTCSPRWRLAGG